MASSASATDTYEVELKLQPTQVETLDSIWALDRIGQFRVVSRDRHRLHNRYYDSSDHALDRGGGNLRWRTIEGSNEAELTYKGPSEVHDGVFRRLEITSLLSSDADPLTVEPPPRPVVLARAVASDLALTDLILESDRRGMRLEGLRATVELDLDISTMAGTPYFDLEIEAEMVAGNPAVLAELEAAIAAIGPVSRSVKGKRARGWSFLTSRQASAR